MSKLNNIKAINEMIRGVHRTQTRKSRGFEKNIIERNIGDSWIESNGQKWIQKNGYKLKVGKLSNIRNVIDQTLCPKCDKKATEFDKQFITREGVCHDCVVKEETLMMCEGYVKNKPIYEQWERTKIRKNVNSFLKDAASDVEMLKQQFNKAEFVNSDGTIEKWNLPESVDSVNVSLDKQFIKFKDELLESLLKGDVKVGINKSTEN